ncbi:DUF3861 domain-containing protein [Vibrio breoganii]|uniref:DUF3861 domain-containing protein n=1 Tax=Vibrio breoganii TaxID=553239 RepID=UPI000C8372DF|nr:DUF3861 domain-containing protein [Vibrio breoganii]PMF83461.1 hypothetical protein BCV08_14875 [Vibrio breoganii]PMG03069.1 hypothetical protein BCV02_09855 [Vibrio breoganii]PMH12125.1 hypothetical protein BCU74_17810 [Vibrio breoganii]PMM18137.1 hypothetical protein BCT60_17905 [Vibrio breoganii]
MTRITRQDHNYRITIEEVMQEESKTLQFEFQDREDMFKVVEMINKGSELPKEEATRVALALRLLGPVMMQNRKHPLFADFMPHFKNFMQNLKSTIKASVSA